MKVLAILAAITFLFGVPTSYGAAPNLAQNGSFDTNLSGWTNPTNGAVTTTWDAGTAKATVVSPASTALLQDGLALTGGVTYTFGARIRLQTASSSSAAIEIVAVGDPTGARFAEAMTHSTAWDSVSGYLYNETASAKTAQVRLLVPGDASEVVFFDDVYLQAVPASAEFTASKTAIAPGEQVTLTWSTMSAPQVTIDQGIGARSRAGSILVSPAATTTYTLTATGPVGTVTKQLTVTVAQPKPQIAFAGSPATVAEGESATLSWTVLNASAVSIDHGIGARGSSGSAAVTPPATTTYRLTAIGPGGNSTADVRITVLPAPVIVFTATPDAIYVGQSATLAWTTAGATIVLIDHDVGAQPPSGVLDVHPPLTTTYVLTASGPGGVRVAQATVTVKVPARRRSVRR